MQGDYRDDLAAAHARIAELEEKIGALEAELSKKSMPPDPEIQELEVAVALRRAAADPKRTAGLQAFLRTVGVALSAGLLFLAAKGAMPPAVIAAIILFAVLLAQSILRRRLPKARRALADAERRLAEARRVRVDAAASATPAEADVLDADGAEDQNVVRFRA